MILQIIDWRKKLEDLRLQELRSRRLADRLTRENLHIQDLAKSQVSFYYALELYYLNTLA